MAARAHAFQSFQDNLQEKKERLSSLELRVENKQGKMI